MKLHMLLYIWVKVIAHWVRHFRVRFSIFPYSSSFPIKMHATDAKTQKTWTWSEFFYDGRKFRRRCVNVIDTTWGHIYFLTCENFVNVELTLSVYNVIVMHRSNRLLIPYRSELQITYFCRVAHAIFIHSPNKVQCVCKNPLQKTGQNEKHLGPVLKNQIFAGVESLLSST